MMTKREVLDKIREAGVVPVIRADSPESALEVCEAILEGGINCLEVTMTVPDALRVIGELDEKYGDEVLLGAGTVLDAQMAQSCVEAGAKFIITPFLSLETIEFCNRVETVICAGALTPTEIYTAWRAGADCVKVFPASAAGGASYLKSILAPFPQISLIPTGGVNIETIGDYFAAGAYAVGVGGELADAKILRAKGREEIIRLAALYREKFLTAKAKND